MCLDNNELEEIEELTPDEVESLKKQFDPEVCFLLLS